MSAYHVCSAVLTCYLGLAGLACHRPLPAMSQTPSYPVRPAESDVDVESILAGYSDRVGQAPAAAKDALSAKAVRRLALDNNPEVLLAKARVDRARARLLASSAWPNPELDGLYLLDEAKSFHSETTFRFSLPLGGRIGAAEELAARELDLANLELISARRRALLQVDRQLVRLVHARSRLGLVQSLAGRSRKYAELARTRRMTAVADPLDVALILADARTDSRAVQRETIKVQKLEQQLRFLVGLPPHEGNFELGTHQRVKLIEPADSLEKDAARLNSTVLRAKLQVLIADHKAARVAAERVPDLQVGPAVTTEGDNLAVGLSVGMPVPLLQTGRGPYEEALAERRLAQEAYHQAVRTAVSEVSTMLSGLSSHQQELDELQGEAGEALEDAVKLAEVRYSAGKLDVLRLLSVHRAFSELKLEQIDLLRKIHESIIDLQGTVGRLVKVEEVK